MDDRPDTKYVKWLGNLGTIRPADPGKVLEVRNGGFEWVYPSFYYDLPRKLKKFYKKHGRLR